MLYVEQPYSGRSLIRSTEHSHDIRGSIAECLGSKFELYKFKDFGSELISTHETRREAERAAFNVFGAKPRYGKLASI